MDDKELLNKILLKVVEIDQRLDVLATKQEVFEVRNDVTNIVDGFAGAHKTLDQELAALRSKYDRVEARIVIMEQKMGIA